VKKLLFVVLCILSVQTLAADNSLSEQEIKDGWRLLFDGQDLSAWRNYQKPDLNSGWLAVDGEMQLQGEGGGDILTKDSFNDFDLKLDWKISTAGNSGIFVMVDEKGSQIYSHAPEVQILDNLNHPDNKLATHLSGSLYDLIASPDTSHKAAGEWNQVRILLQKSRLQVWQNQIKTADIVIGSDEWHTLLAHSKFADWQGFAAGSGGHIGLQDHGNSVSFKNIKIKEL
jgi:hypothetical protein